jgi:cytochrome P450
MSYGAGDTVETIKVPDHVPPELVVDFDYFNPPGIRTDPHAAWKAMQDGPPLIFTPRNGGHWIATQADPIYDAMQDFEGFSSNPFNIPRRPAGSPKTIPLEIDPPELQRYRMIAVPSLSPKALAAMEANIHNKMEELVAELKPKGQCEFIGEFAVRFPVELFLDFVNLPPEDRPLVRKWVEDVARNPDPQAQHAAHVGTINYLTKVLEQRKTEPKGDLFDKLVNASKEGKITFEEAVGMSLNILFGGIETVTSALSFIARFLAENPGHRRELRENPDLTRDAVEEFMRRFGILSLGRTAARDFEFHGLQIKKDDRILLPIHLYSLDERRFERPMEVDFHREHFRHINFGAGPHRCIGSNLARPELRIFLDTWLREIPDFSIAPGEAPTGSGGAALSITYLPLVW